MLVQDKLFGLFGVKSLIQGIGWTNRLRRVLPRSFRLEQKCFRDLKIRSYA